MKKKAKSSSHGFETFNLSPNVYNAIKRKGYAVPSPIQRKTIPLILSGADVVAMSRTGSGKTAAFLIPMLEKLSSHANASARALLLSPTRDLALQTLKFTHELARYTDLKTCLLVGGDSMEAQFEQLAQNPDIILATPGRLMHHLSEVKDLSLKSVEYLVFDEADCLFEMGFAEQLHSIITQLSENRQTLLFSATLPSALADFAKAGLRDHHFIRLDVEKGISSDLTMVFLTLKKEDKYAALLYLIREQISSNQQCMIFVSTRSHVEFLNLLFKEDGMESSMFYSEMDLDARKYNMSRFRSKKTMLAFVTDSVSRGTDIPFLDNVFNFDFPYNPKLFVHRVGRVARAGRSGTAFSFVTSEDMAYLLDLHLFLGKPFRAAPVGSEVLQDVDGVMAKYDQAISNGETIYGSFPQALLSLNEERVRDMVKSNSALGYLQKTCANSFTKYTKIRQSPSKASIRRVKDLPQEGLHPMFKGLLGANELTALGFSEQLKSFRLKQTVIEFEGRAAKSKNLEGPSSKWFDVMKRKKAVHEEIINQTHQQRCSTSHTSQEVETETIPVKLTERKETRGLKRKANSLKDEEYFISPVPVNQHREAGLCVRTNQGSESNRLESAVMDLVADDNFGLQKQKTVHCWDKKRKKYIKLNNGERLSASGKIKTESGRRLKVTNTGIYDKWKQRSHNKILPRGTENSNNGEASTSYSGGSSGWKFSRAKKNHSVPNAHLHSEIKDREQVRKERQKKGQRLSYMKTSSKKGYKHPRKGGKRKGK